MRVVVALIVFLLAGCAGVQRPTAADEVPSLTQQQLVQVADVLAARGDSVRAQQYLLQAERQGAGDEHVLPRLLRLYVADGQYRLAIEHGENYLRRHPNDTRLRELQASLYAAVGYGNEALAQYEQVVAREPGNAEAHYAIAALLGELGGEHVRIDEHYRAYLALDPRGAHAEEARAGLLEVLR